MLPDGEEEQGEEDLTEWDDDGKGERDEREIISRKNGSSFVSALLKNVGICSHGLRVFHGIRFYKRVLHPQPLCICSP